MSAGILVIALICALTIAIVAASRRVAWATSETDPAVQRPTVVSGRSPQRSAAVAGDPSGARGPRAPTATLVG
ncbi:MAG: hypothetical protein FWD85_02995 [Microbacteriaceae bacterium]|nr:hypothetical protein [Microbacteriaceae bacterium]